MAVIESIFKDSVVVVTGGAKGIGRACVEAFLSEGAKVSVISRTRAELESLKNSLSAGERLLINEGDVSDEKAVYELFDQTERKLGPIRTLVNNAAVLKNQNITSLQKKDWDEVMSINVGGVFLCSREFFRRVEREPRVGSIVNVSSLAGVRGTDKFPGFSSYVASKFAVVGLTESLAVEGRSLSIRVNCVAPGAVDTELLHRVAPHLKTETKPLDIAKVVLFLADQIQSGKISGTTLEIFSNLK